jgi:predicted NBD/HSP70 family sugar kinase
MTSCRSDILVRSWAVGRVRNLTIWDGRWVGFDLVRAFGCPVKVVNDAAMQAPGQL